MKENKSLYILLILLILVLIFSLARIIKPLVFDEFYYTTYAYTFDDGSTMYMSAEDPAMQSKMDKILGTVSKSRNTLQYSSNAVGQTDSE